MSSYDFFLAHTGPDTAQAERLYDLLTTETSVFLDSKSIVLGDDWDRTLAEAQRQSRVTVVLVSASTDAAFYQREEIAAAIDLARKPEAEHRVVPVYLEPVPTGAPYGLRLKHGLAISSRQPIEQVAARLLHLHRTLVAQAPGPASSPGSPQPVLAPGATVSVPALLDAAGDQLGYDIRLNPVKDLLVRYIYRPADIGMISIQSGLDQGSIAAGGSAVNYWQEVLQRACIEGVFKVDAVLDRAIHHLEHTIGEAPLRAAVEKYRQARG